MGPVEVDLVVGAIERQLDRLIRLSLVDILEQLDSSLRATVPPASDLQEIVALVGVLSNSGLGRPKELRGRRLFSFPGTAAGQQDTAQMPPSSPGRGFRVLGCGANHRSRTRPASRQGAMSPSAEELKSKPPGYGGPCVTPASWWRSGPSGVRSTLGVWEAPERAVADGFSNSPKRRASPSYGEHYQFGVANAVLPNRDGSLETP